MFVTDDSDLQIDQRGWLIIKVSTGWDNIEATTDG